MKKINNAVLELVSHKASLIKKSPKYRSYLKELLKELDVNDPVEASLVGAVDAMIYDVACALDFTKQKGKISDWASWSKRKEVIIELWK